MANSSVAPGIVPKLSGWVSLGHPVLNARVFDEFIDKVFSHCRAYKDVSKFENPKLYITVTDIVNHVGHTLNQGDLKRTVVDSCSIPIALRSFEYLSASHLVDGGLCNNLPVECLLEDQRTPIFAVFPVEKSVPTRLIICLHTSCPQCLVPWNIT